MPKKIDFTDDQRQEAWDLYAEHKSWARVAREMCIGVTTLKEKMGVVLQQRSSSLRRLPANVVSSSTRKRDGALFDPHKAEPPIYENEINAAVLGDPPRGRRELLEANARRTAPPDSHPNAKHWHL